MFCPISQIGRIANIVVAILRICLHCHHQIPDISPQIPRMPFQIHNSQLPNILLQIPNTQNVNLRCFWQPAFVAILLASWCNIYRPHDKYQELQVRGPGADME